MKYNYKTLYEKNAAFYQARPFLQNALQTVSHVITGLCGVAYCILLYFAFTTPYAVSTLIPLLSAPALCFVIVTVLRLAIFRPRPYAENGANIIPLSKKKDGENHSFPSRHVACAFVIATVFLPLIPWAGISLLLLSTVLAYVRFSLGLHYPTDLLAGAIIGILCGLWILI